jgi:hypothetical protein
MTSAAATASKRIPGRTPESRPAHAKRTGTMKRVLWILISIFLHPVAVVLMWINVSGRADLNLSQKIIWCVVGIVWGLGPTLYVLVGGGALW